MKLTYLAQFFFSSRPSQAVFFLTYQCNSRCSWCNAWQRPKQKELTFTQIKKKFRQLKKFGIKLLYFSGGEPLLHQGFLAIVKLAQQFGFDLILVTNGILLDGRIIHQLAKISSLHINVSLDTLDPKLYQKIRGVDGLDQVIKNLKLFKKLYPRFPLRVTMTVSAANINEVEKVYRFCRQNKIYFSPNPYFDVGEFRKYSHLHDYHPIKKKLINYYRKIAKRVKDEPFLSGFPIVYQKLSLWLEGKMKEPCGAGQEIIFINPTGKVYACQDLKPFADLKKEDLAQKWSQKKWLPAVKKCYQKTPCFIFCTRSPYLLKHHPFRLLADIATSKKRFHYLKMY